MTHDPRSAQPETGNERVTVMADDETQDETPVVDVETTTVEAPDAVVEASPTIIVEAGGDDDGESVEEQVDAAVETERRFGNIENMLSSLAVTVGEIDARTRTTEAVQEQVVDAVVETAETVEDQGEALAEEIEDSIPEDVGEDPKDDAPTSAREHWFFRSRKNFKN